MINNVLLILFTPRESYIYTYLSLDERHPSRCTYFYFCKEIPYATCQTIHSYFPRHFAAYLLHFECHFCYMFTFHSHTCSYIWEATWCYIYSHIKNNFMLHIHWKRNFCTTHSHFERQFHAKCSYSEKHFWAIFNIYAHLQSIRLPIQHTHVHG